MSEKRRPLYRHGRTSQEKIAGNKDEILMYLSQRVPLLFSDKAPDNSIKRLLYRQEVVLGSIPGFQNEESPDDHLFFKSKISGSIHITAIGEPSVSVVYEEADGSVDITWSGSGSDEESTGPEGVLLDMFQFEPPGKSNTKIPLMMIDGRGAGGIWGKDANIPEVVFTVSPEGENYELTIPKSPSKKTSLTSQAPQIDMLTVKEGLYTVRYHTGVTNGEIIVPRAIQLFTA